MTVLEQWHLYETDNPRTFINMYQFLLRGSSGAADLRLVRPLIASSTSYLAAEGRDWRPVGILPHCSCFHVPV